MILDTLPNGLRPLQITGALRCYTDRAEILADQPGAGKTLQALFALELDEQFITPDSRILITAPKTACQLMWARELQVRIASQYPVVIADLTGSLGTKRKTSPSVAERDVYLGQKMVEAHEAGLPLIVLVNHEGLRWNHRGKPGLTNLWQNRWSAILVDESHLVLPNKQDDPKKFTQFWYGLDRLVTEPRALRIAMSGTPDNGKLENRFGTYRFLFPSRFASYWAWVKYFFYTNSNRWGGLDVLALRREEEWNQFQSAVMVRRTKAEMLKGLPPKQHVDVELPLTDHLRDRYDEFERETQEKIDRLLAEADRAEGKEAELLLAEAKGVEFLYKLRARQLAITDWYTDQESQWHPKGGRDVSVHLDWICEFLLERDYHVDAEELPTGKVVITSYFVEVLKWLQAELEKEGFGRIPILSGDTSLEEKLRIEDEFQRGALPLILFSGHIGVAISLDAADDMIFVDLVHDPDKVEQTEDRIHRASSSGVKQLWRLIAENTIAEAIVDANNRRFNVTRKSYDGSRGVDFRRRMLKAEEAVA